MKQYPVRLQASLTALGRLKANSSSLLEMCSRLNVYGNTPFAELSGVMPAVGSSHILERRRYDFTLRREDGVVKVCTTLFFELNEKVLSPRSQTPNDTWLFRRDVTRGLRSADDDAERSVVYTGTLPIARYC